MTGTPYKRAPSLVPTGTARGLFLGTEAADSDQTFLREVGDPLRAHDVSDETLLHAWEATRWASAASVSERRALGCLVVALLEAIDAGGTYLTLASPMSPARIRTDALGTALIRLGLPEADRKATRTLADHLVAGTASPSIAALFGPPNARRPFILADGALYPERLWAAETHLIALLRARLTTRVPPLQGSVDDALAAVGGTKGATPLVDEQVAALRAALVNPLTVIAGGPGSGKTSIVVALLRALARMGVPMDRIALAAPTGRAAQRIKESVSAALARLENPAQPDVDLARDFTGATTLHRLLGIRSGRLRGLEADAPTYFSDWRLPHKVVVVDEASMIDLLLMEQLAAAVPDDARLILLGDADQLPSVQVGAVLRELVAGAPTATRRLARSHRMSPQDPAGAAILRVAMSVNAGAPVTDDAPVHERATDLHLLGFERLAANKLGTFLDRWHREILRADDEMAAALDHLCVVDDKKMLPDQIGRDATTVKALLATHAAARILCLTRTAGRNTSADAINRLLHVRVAAAALARGAGEGVTTAPFIPGEPVIVLRNDHARELSNGDLGVVLRVRVARGEVLGVAFPRQDLIVVHALDDLDGNVALAFALTVHKAQGSEYDRVALVLPETDVPLLSREILYTALSRARRGVVVIGDPDLFALGAGRTLTRTSGIARGLGVEPADRQR